MGGTGRMARRIEEALERQPKNRIWCDFGGGINAQHRLAGHSPAVGRAISARMQRALTRLSEGRVPILGPVLH